MRTAPSLQHILSPLKKYQRKRFEIKLKTAMFVKASMFMVKLAAMRVTPRINVMFRKPLPTIFARARLMLFPFVASRLVANSGMLVPNATMVAPITTLGTPRLNAMNVAESTI